MIRLLRANFTRLRQEKSFLFCCGAMALYALILCFALNYSMHRNNTEIAFDGVFLYGYGLYGFLAVPGLLMAVFCSVFLGTEFSDGTIRNKLIVGRTRTEIYLANFLTCAAAGILMHIVYAAVVCAVGIPLFGFFQMSASTLGMLILNGTLMLISYAAIFTMLSMLVQNKTTVSILSLLGVVLLMFLTIFLIARIAEPEYIDTIEIIKGEQVWKTIPNSRYLSPVMRKIFQFVIDFLPTGQSLQISGMTAPHLWGMALYAALITGISNVAGMVFFRRKDLK